MQAAVSGTGAAAVEEPHLVAAEDEAGEIEDVLLALVCLRAAAARESAPAVAAPPAPLRLAAGDTPHLAGPLVHQVVQAGDDLIVRLELEDLEARCVGVRRAGRLCCVAADMAAP
jgi:hypothetical protein